MADETRQIQVLLGPYRDQRLTVSSADADAAINNHWAVDPFAHLDPDEEPHPPLSEEERTAALEAANTWAKQTWDAAQGVSTEPPPEGGGGETTAGGESQGREQERERERQRQRDMQADQQRPPGYQTRGPGRPPGR